MTHATRPAALFVCVLTAAMLLPVAASFGAEIDDVLEHWRQRQRQFATVRFRLSGMLFKPAGYSILPENLKSKLGTPQIPIPAEDHEEAIESELLLDLDGGRLRRHWIKEQLRVMPTAAEGGFVPYPLDEVAVYNGEQFKFYTPYELNGAKSPEPMPSATELGIYERRAKIVLHLEHNPLLYACGIIQTTLAHDPADLQPELNPREFRIESESELEGQRCLVVRTVPDWSERFFEFWVDAEDPRKIPQVHGYGLNGDGKLWVTTKIAYQETEHGPIPESWTIDRHNHATEKVARYTITLDEFEANPAVTDADFDIDPPPGTVVYDETRPEESRNYVVAGPGKPDLPVGEHQLQEERRNFRFWLTTGIIGIILLMSGAVFFYRRQQE